MQASKQASIVWSRPGGPRHFALGTWTKAPRFLISELPSTAGRELVGWLEGKQKESTSQGSVVLTHEACLPKWIHAKTFVQLWTKA